MSPSQGACFHLLAAPERTGQTQTHSQRAPAQRQHERHRNSRLPYEPAGVLCCHCPGLSAGRPRVAPMQSLTGSLRLKATAWPALPEPSAAPVLAKPGSASHTCRVPTLGPHSHPSFHLSALSCDPSTPRPPFRKGRVGSPHHHQAFCRAGAGVFLSLCSGFASQDHELFRRLCSTPSHMTLSLFVGVISWGLGSSYNTSPTSPSRGP